MSQRGIPKMTVAVVCYNNFHTIESAVRSVTEQSMSGIEVLVIDDHSTDGSHELLTELLNTGLEFTYLRTEKNSGSASAGRNIAIRQAKGEYLAFLDGDDVLAPNACFNLYTNAKKSGADIVTGQMLRRNVSTGKIVRWHGWLFRESKTLSSAEEVPDLVYDSTSTSKVYSTDFLRINDLKFTEGVYFEDNEFSQKAYSLAKKIRIIPDFIYYWEVYPAEQRLTITSNWKNLKSYSDRIRAFFVGYQSYEAQGLKKIKQKLIEKTITHDIWLFIDRAAKEEDVVTILNLWREAEKVLAAADEELILSIPLMQRAKISALRAGDIEAYLEAMTLAGKLSGVSGVFVDEYWFPAHWYNNAELRTRFAKYLKLDKLTENKLRDNYYTLRHQATKVQRASGKILVSGSTLNRFNQFDNSRDLEVLVKLGIKDGTTIETYRGDFIGWDGLIAQWSFELGNPRYDTYLRNQEWKVELSLVQGERAVQEVVYAPRKMKRVVFTPRGNNVKNLLLDRLSVYVAHGNIISLRRFSRPKPWGLGSHVLSTLSRKVKLANNKTFGRFSKDRQLRIVSKLGRSMPIKKDLVVFESHLGKQFSDSPRAIFEELRMQHPKLDMVWSFASPWNVHHCPTSSVKRHSLRYAWLLARAAVVVDNQGFPAYYKRRKGQLYFQTWHGVPLKTMGKESPHKGRKELEATRRSVSNWSVTFSPTEYYQQHLNDAMFYTGKALPLGLPRNDSIVSDSVERDALLKELQLPKNKKLILWAPTFRENKTAQEGVLDSLLSIDKLMDALPEDYVLLVRCHYLDKITFSNQHNGRVLNVSGVHDISRLYCVADMLITDYSSVMFDFALTKKPIVIYAPDYTNYKEKQRGLIFDISAEAPGKFISNQSELAEVIISGLEEVQTVSSTYQNFIEKYCGNHPPISSRKSAELIIDWISR